MKTALLLSVHFSLLVFVSCYGSNGYDPLENALAIQRSRGSVLNTVSNEDHSAENSNSPVYLAPQHGLKDADKISSLPGEPAGTDFDQYSGYVTVDPKHGRALFYYLAESPVNSSANPLVLWLNGGPGCSSFGNGAMMELGPFRVNPDNTTLSRNKYAWNNVANVLFLDSPAGVGFSYSNTSSDYETGDKQTAKDTYTFLINWLERFPEYKIRDFYIAGESYAGHYVPQLAQLVLQNNKITNQTVIKLKGIAIGNAYIDQETQNTGMFDYFWTHAIISDEIYEGIISNCNFSNGANITDACINYQYQAFVAKSNIFFYDIYAPLCTPFSNSTPSISGFDPCTENYVLEYLNTPVVQQSLHAKPVQWEFCNYGGNGYDPLENTLKIQRLRRMTMNHVSQQDANVEYSYSHVYVGPQDGFKDADKISELPGQPAGTDFYQYSGYVTVDPSHGRALFYHLAESPVNSSTNPLVLWLNGGPGCSSFGNGAMMELGSFRVNADNATLNTPAVQQALHAKPVEWESWFI